MGRSMDLLLLMTIEIFCEEHGIIHEFSSPRTPQQNGVVERKNRSLQEIARTMIHETKMAAYFWAEAVNTACYVQNRIYIRPILNKTSYELFKGRKPSISYFHQFGCTCYILNNKHYLKKFSAKAQRGIFIGYSERSKAYRAYNSETNMVKESIHVKFDDKEPGREVSELSMNFAGMQISGCGSEARSESASDKISESPEAEHPNDTPEEASEHSESEEYTEAGYSDIAHDGSREDSESHPEAMQFRS